MTRLSDTGALTGRSPPLCGGTASEPLPPDGPVHGPGRFSRNPSPDTGGSLAGAIKSMKELGQ